MKKFDIDQLLDPTGNAYEICHYCGNLVRRKDAFYKPTGFLGIKRYFHKQHWVAWNRKKENKGK